MEGVAWLLVIGAPWWFGAHVRRGFRGEDEQLGAGRVDIDGATVGYLSRPAAKAYRKRLKKASVSLGPRECPAVIRGGWDRGRGDRGGLRSKARTAVRPAAYGGLFRSHNRIPVGLPQ